MAGYVKIWTSIFNNEQFLSLTTTERAIYLQVLIWCKMGDDSGIVRYRSVAHAGQVWGCDRKTAGRAVGKVAAKSLWTYTVEPSGIITIKIPNYKKWQSLSVDEVVAKTGRPKGKVNAKSRLPEQSRADQTRAKHISSGKPTKTSGAEKEKKETDPNHAPFVKSFCEEYQETFGFAYDFAAGKDGQHIADILKFMRDSKEGDTWKEELADMVRIFFSLPRNEVGKDGHTIGSLFFKRHDLRELLHQ